MPPPAAEIPPQSRQLVLPGLHNIRDLGGLPRQTGGVTLPGRVLRGCDQSELSPAGRSALLARGLGSVVDLRSAREYAAGRPALDGLPRRHIPLFEALEPVYKSANSSRGFSLTARYLQALERAGPRFAEVVTAVAEAPAGAVLIHCTAGKDRTGLVSALLLGLAGVGPEAILEDYRLSATAARAYLDRLARRSQARKTAPHLLAALLAAPTETMAASLDWLQSRHGGAAGYLRAAGLPEPVLRRAAARLTDPD